MRNHRVSRRYAQALMDIAAEQKSVDAVAADLASIGATLAASRDLQLLVASPVIQEGKKLAIFRELWEPRVGRVTMAFLSLLVTKRRETILPGVIEDYLALRFYDSFQNPCFYISGVFINHRHQRFQNFFDSLVELRFTGITL